MTYSSNIPYIYSPTAYTSYQPYMSNLTSQIWMPEIASLWNTTTTSSATPPLASNTPVEQLTEEQRQEELNKCYEELMALEENKKNMQVDTTGIAEAGKGLITINDEKDMLDEQGNPVARYATSEDVEKALTNAKKDMEENVKEDGSFKKSPKLKDLKWHKKLGIVGGGVLAAWGKMAMNFLTPHDENGKFDKKRLVKNLAITAACAGATLIPVAGPFIAWGMLAFGAGAGLVSAGRGVVKLCQLDKNSTADELKAGVEETAVGITVGVASACGLRGMSKAMRTASGNVIKDITVNSFKAAKQQALSDKSIILRCRQNGSGKLKAFGQTIREKFNISWQQSESQKQFEKDFKDKKTALKSKIKKLEQKIGRTTDGKEKTLLTYEKNGLESSLNEMCQARTKQDWANFGSKKSSSNGYLKEQIKGFRKDFKKNGEVTINRRKFKADNLQDRKLLEQTLKRMEQDCEAMQKDFTKLASEKKGYIWKSSLKKINDREVVAYTGKTNYFTKFWEIIKPVDAKATAIDVAKAVFLPWKWPNTVWSTVKTAWNLVNKPFIWGNRICKKPASVGYQIHQLAFPVYMASRHDITLTKEELDEIKKAIDDKLAEINSKKYENGAKETEIKRRIEELNYA